MTSDIRNNAGPSNADHLTNAVETAAQINGGDSGTSAKSAEGTISPPSKVAPKSWADLVRTKGPPPPTKNGNINSDTIAQANIFAPTKAGSLADALSSYNVKESSETAKVAFLEPRGLVNTGNMCYMNSVRSFTFGVSSIATDIFSDSSSFGFLCTFL